jgi:uncharacterized protein
VRKAFSSAVTLCVAVLAIAGCTSSPDGVGARPAAAQGDAALAATSPAAPLAVASSVIAALPSASSLPTPLTALEIGDSLGEDLGFGLDDVLRHVDGARLVQAAKGNSGLVQPQYYDWPKHLEQLLDEYSPDVVVVFLGANDVQDFYANGILQQFGTPSWEDEYARRVATMMQEATAAGAKVLWVGMPIMKSAAFSSSMTKLNAIYQAQAALHPGVSYFASWDLFTGAAGDYVSSTQVGEKTVTLRTPDGVHITFGNGGGGADLLAQAVVDALPPLLAG